jgi:predicted nucleic acid-binding protein
MVKVLLDSNIIIDIMNGVKEARTEVSYYSDITISAITWMEVMVGCMQSKQTALFETFLTTLGIKVIHTNDAISLKAAQIRAAGLSAIPKRQIKLPDAIIAATAQTSGLMVVTRNPRDFGASKVRIPYQIDANGTAINILQPPS